MKHITKKEVVCDIIRAYQHDWHTEGKISKRRLWYILKPQFAAANLDGILHKGKQVQPISNEDYNKQFNDLARDGEIDDTFILDNSRVMNVGLWMPHIILVSEKKTIENTVRTLADRLGCSMYIAGGFSSIYGAKKLEDMIRYGTEETAGSNEPLTILTLTDYDKSGHEISETVEDHFTDPWVYRVLLKVGQIPPGKEDQYFDVVPFYGKTYELDILNTHQLVEVFLNHVPEEVADEIKEHYESRCHSEAKRIAIENAIWEDKNFLVLQDQILSIQKELSQLEGKLQQEFDEQFDDADPIVTNDFTINDVYDQNTVCEVAGEWLS